jgi:hypothetical protein
MITYKRILSVTKITPFTKIQQDTKIQRSVSETTISQACPNSTYSIGPPSLATTQSTQESKKEMPPQVGYSTSFLIHTTTSKLTRYSILYSNVHIDIRNINQ